MISPPAVIHNTERGPSLERRCLRAVVLFWNEATRVVLPSHAFDLESTATTQLLSSEKLFGNLEEQNLRLLKIWYYV